MDTALLPPREAAHPLLARVAQISRSASGGSDKAEEGFGKLDGGTRLPLLVFIVNRHNLEPPGKRAPQLKDFLNQTGCVCERLS